MAHVLRVGRRIRGSRFIWDVEILSHYRRFVVEMSRNQLVRAYNEQIPKFTMSAHADMSHCFYPGKYIVTFVRPLPEDSKKILVTGFRDGILIEREFSPEKLQQFLYQQRKRIILLNIPPDQKFILRT